MSRRPVVFVSSVVRLASGGAGPGAQRLETGGDPRICSDRLVVTQQPYPGVTRHIEVVATLELQDQA